MQTIQEYQQLANRTCPDLGSMEDNLLHMRLGIYTEIGELLDVIKKNLAYKKAMDIVNIGEEIADIAWYVVNDDSFRGYESHISEVFGCEVKSLNDVVKGGEAILYAFSHYKTSVNGHLPIHSLDNMEVLDILRSLATYFNLDFMQLLQNNIDKLKVRYPEKFDEHNALNRNLDKERGELEK